MSRVCEICGKGPSAGNKITRRGLPKYKGGIGLHTTGVTKRRFLPNIRLVRAVVDGTRRRVRTCAACLKQGRVQKV
ncbi:MAG: 50S ribosomal protein L28 [Lentisphaerae bacterium]|jgi:large subunit ribosomal protein L28|nr:50S ribosomal protein L28 [Lentisphaerota bacterium]